MTSPKACPELASLQSLVEGTLAPSEQTELTEHLENCDGCQQKVEELAGGEGSWAVAARHAGHAAAVEPPLEHILERCQGEPGMNADEPPGPELPTDFLDPPDRPGALGRFGTYEVLELTGRGGMGIVLKAFDQTLQRVVAIKVLAPQLAAGPNGRKRFIREARAAAAVRDQHVVDIHAVGEHRGLPYLVMEFVSGISLQEKLEAGDPLLVPELLRIGIQTAAGLAAAHAHGLIHRDIKPANILLENGVERVKITDFGLARVADDASLTQSGVVSGTPQYMAPEQARGDAVDHRADLFSLGSVLYALCTGEPPFRAAGNMAALKRVCDDTPRPVREVNLDAPEWLVAVIERLHAKNPADRFQSASEVAELLAGYLAHLQGPTPGALPARPTPASVADRRRGRPYLVAAAVLAGAVVLTAVVVYSRRPAADGTAPELEAAAPPAHSEPTLAGFATRIDAGLSDDPADPAVASLRRELIDYRARHFGQPEAVDAARLMARLAWPADALRREQMSPADLAAAGDGDPALAPKNLVAVLGDGRLAHWAGVTAVAFSPDGQMLASAGGDHAVRLWDPDTGLLRWSRREHLREFWSVRYSPDGTLVVAGGMDGKARVWDAKTGDERQVIGAHPNWWVMDAVFASDNQTLATGGSDGVIHLWNAFNGSRQRTLPRGHREGIISMALAPGDKTLVTSSFDKTVIIWSLDDAHPPRTLTGHTDWVQSVVVDRDGKLVVSGSKDGTVRIWDLADGTERRPPLRGPGSGVASLALSPDGRTLAAGFDSGLVKLWQTDTWQDGPSWKAHLGAIRGLAFRPDGKTLATGGYHDCGVRLWNVATGTEVPDRAGPRAALASVAFSPDGASVAAGCRDGTVRVWDVAGRTVRRLLRHEHPVGGVAFHPAGQTLAVGTDAGVWAWDLTGTADPQVLKSGEPIRSAAFSLDGRLVAGGRQDGLIRLWDADSGDEKRNPLEGHRAAVHTVAFAPDGHRLASGSADGAILIWELGTASKRAIGSAQAGSVQSLSFSPDGQWLCAGQGHRVLQWDAVTGQERRVEAGMEHLRGVQGVTFCPDGELIASAGGDGTVRVFEARTGRQRQSIAVGPPPRSDVLGIAFSPDGRHLAAANANGTVSILRLASGPK